MKHAILLCCVLCMAWAAVTAGATEITVPGPDPDLLAVFNHASGYASDPYNPVRVAKRPPPRHHGHVTILKLWEPGTGGPGGGLGGSTHPFSAADEALFRIELFDADDPGRGSRIIDIPISGEIHTGPRTPGDAVQTFDAEMFRLQGQILGDPDFDLLGVRAGSGFGLPSPGHTTLTRLGPPGSDFVVDSFFDITYEIDFVGAPGGVYDGVSGTESGTTRFGLGHTFIPEPSAAALLLLGLASMLRQRSRRRPRERQE